MSEGIHWLVGGAGWAGMAMIVLAFAGVAFEPTFAKMANYHLLNLVGSVLFGLELYVRRAWSGVWLQVIWCVIALGALYRMAS